MTGVILFRAQPFHNGHLKMIKDAYEDCLDLDINLVILVGSADKCGTKRNPLPIDLRLKLINSVLETEFSEKERRRIAVVPLKDLDDEANNTASWGHYLYDNICDLTNDNNFIIYYSDKPEIMLSWFDAPLRKKIAFKFLERYEGICATQVRKMLINREEHLAPIPWPIDFVMDVYQYLIEAK